MRLIDDKPQPSELARTGMVEGRSHPQPFRGMSCCNNRAGLVQMDGEIGDENEDLPRLAITDDLNADALAGGVDEDSLDE